MCGNIPDESLDQEKHLIYMYLGQRSSQNLIKYGSNLRRVEPRPTFNGSKNKRGP